MTSQLPANTEDIPLDRCWELLTQQRIARLAVVHQGEPDIFPVSYVVDHGGIVFRTGAGTKLAAASGHPVALEVDGEDDVQGTHWSVVLKGRASRVEGVKAVLQDVVRPAGARAVRSEAVVHPDRSACRSPADVST